MAALSRDEKEISFHTEMVAPTVCQTRRDLLDLQFCQRELPLVLFGFPSSFCSDG
jgi:hypothetical protein